MVNTLDAGFGGEGQISLNILKTVFLGKRRIGRAYKRKKTRDQDRVYLLLIPIDVDAGDY